MSPRRKAASSLTLLGALAACNGSSFSQVSSGTDASTGGEAGITVVIADDAGAADVGVTDAGMDATSPGSPSEDASMEAEASPPPLKIVYVSNVGGVDTNSGLSPSSPKKTIAAGILAAEPLTGGEVHVCKGVYAESALELDVPVSLMGSYDCTAWTRTATYGYPTFDDVNETTIENGDYAAQTATLLVSGSVRASVAIDGFSIQGAPAPTATGLSVAISVQGLASPVISNNDIAGGGGKETSTTATSQPGSVGIGVAGGASPEITLNRITGGKGSAAGMGYGSTGVFLAGTGTPNVHDDRISGGVPTAGNVAGIQSTTTVTRAAGNALKNLTVSGVDFGDVVSTFSVGILVQGSASADIIDSAVYGNAAPSATTLTNTTAIDYDGTGSAYLSGDRVYGGSGASTTSSTIGVEALQGSSFEMDNCMVHGGEGMRGNAVVANANTGTLSFDTIYDLGFFSQYGFATSWGVAIQAYSGAVALHDLLILNGNTGTDALQETNCPGFAGGVSGSGTFSAIDHVVFGDFTWSDFCSNSNNCGVDNTPPTLGTGGSLTSITWLSTSQCTGSCAKSLFGASWGTDDGFTALFTSSETDAGVTHEGWTFASPPPCSIATGGTPITGITTDINGTTRSSLPSVGATEVVGPCVP